MIPEHNHDERYKRSDSVVSFALGVVMLGLLAYLYTQPRFWFWVDWVLTCGGAGCGS